MPFPIIIGFEMVHIVVPSRTVYHMYHELSSKVIHLSGKNNALIFQNFCFWVKAILSLSFRLFLINPWFSCFKFSHLDFYYLMTRKVDLGEQIRQCLTICSIHSTNNAHIIGHWSIEFIDYWYISTLNLWPSLLAALSSKITYQVIWNSSEYQLHRKSLGQD